MFIGLHMVHVCSTMYRKINEVFMNGSHVPVPAVHEKCHEADKMFIQADKAVDTVYPVWFMWLIFYWYFLVTMEIVPVSFVNIIHSHEVPYKLKNH